MKKLKDYVGTTTLISFSSIKEYDKMVPLLNKVYKGWLKSHCIQNLHLTDYIDMYNDYISEKKIKGWRIISASEFLTNNYYFY